MGKDFFWKNSGFVVVLMAGLADEQSILFSLFMSS